MTKKDYIAIAGVIDKLDEFNYSTINKSDLIMKLAVVFFEDNPRFDCGKFFEACQKTPTTINTRNITVPKVPSRLNHCCRPKVIALAPAQAVIKIKPQSKATATRIKPMAPPISAKMNQAISIPKMPIR